MPRLPRSWPLPFATLTVSRCEASEWLFSPDVAGTTRASVNAAAAADRRFGMAKRIEQSRKHGHYDTRGTDRLHAVSESSLPVPAPETPIGSPPVLELVGGTDVTREPLDAQAPERA